jgi:hypothetical protein
MIKALQIRKGTATVATRGLRRIVIQPLGKVVREFAPWREAKEYADAYNGYNKVAVKTWAQVVKYPQ